jgi:hypothetical protein
VSDEPAKSVTLLLRPVLSVNEPVDAIALVAVSRMGAAPSARTANTPDAGTFAVIFTTMLPVLAVLVTKPRRVLLAPPSSTSGVPAVMTDAELLVMTNGLSVTIPVPEQVMLPAVDELFRVMGNVPVLSCTTSVAPGATLTVEVFSAAAVAQPVTTTLLARVKVPEPLAPKPAFSTTCREVVLPIVSTDVTDTPPVTETEPVAAALTMVIGEETELPLSWTRIGAVGATVPPSMPVNLT